MTSSPQASAGADDGGLTPRLKAAFNHIPLIFQAGRALPRMSIRGSNVFPYSFRRVSAVLIAGIRLIRLTSLSV
jgi:hypothetical protein